MRKFLFLNLGHSRNRSDQKRNSACLLNFQKYLDRLKMCGKLFIGGSQDGTWDERTKGWKETQELSWNTVVWTVSCRIKTKGGNVGEKMHGAIVQQLFSQWNEPAFRASELGITWDSTLAVDDDLSECWRVKDFTERSQWVKSPSPTVLVKILLQDTNSYYIKNKEKIIGWSGKFGKH